MFSNVGIVMTEKIAIANPVVSPRYQGMIFDVNIQNTNIAVRVTSQEVATKSSWADVESLGIISISRLNEMILKSTLLSISRTPGYSSKVIDSGNYRYG